MFKGAQKISSPKATPEVKNTFSLTSISKRAKILDFKMRLTYRRIPKLPLIISCLVTVGRYSKIRE